MANIHIDAALDPLSEKIGEYLRKNGKEDASGSRRFVLDLLRKGDTIRVQQATGCTLQEAMGLLFLSV